MGAKKGIALKRARPSYGTAAIAEKQRGEGTPEWEQRKGIALKRTRPSYGTAAIAEKQRGEGTPEWEQRRELP